DAVARFEHEAHVLGQLQHAGIAQIFEAGVADAEFDSSHAMPLPPRMPYYTMEYVQGRNLIEYANAPSSRDHPLDISERLELVARVCDALQHAHQNGIIHRDLKPDNILVVDANVPAGLRSASGTRFFGAQPKLLDFGVAPDDAVGATRDPIPSVVNQGEATGPI
ncbi:MAG: protein kinase, partial [Planctomycetes bacterium]|nr:protein kinase [Planctomycetota bacterium]